MAKTIVVAIFGPVEQLSQEVGTAQEHMTARITTWIIYKGQEYTALCNVKQVTGSLHHEKNNIEVSRPDGYRGPLDFEAWADAATSHYKRTIGESGVGVRLPAGTRNIKMQNNYFDVGRSYAVMECEDRPEAAW